MRLPESGKIEIAPSILSADFSRLRDEICDVVDAGARIIHLDVMDGHFVPNITIGPPVIAKLRDCCDVTFDSHLMITDPEKYVQPFIDAGTDHITFHIEVTEEPEKLIDYIHQQGCTAGICLNPETPVEAVESVAPLCDMVLVMTVHPGFGGQKFMPDAARKIPEIRRIVGPTKRVEVDGGINPDYVSALVGDGADTLVAGSAIFSKQDRRAAIDALKKAAE